MRRIVTFVVACAITGCASREVLSPDNSIAIAPDKLWSGSLVQISSPRIRAGDYRPLVTVDSTTLPVLEQTEGALSVRLPQALVGRANLKLWFNVGDTISAQIDVHGFAAWWNGPETALKPQRAVDGTVVASGKSNVLAFIPWLHTAVPLLPDSSHDPSCFRSPGISLVDGILVSARRIDVSSCRYYAWSGSPPVPVDSTVALGSAWVAAYLGPGRWLINTKYYDYAISAQTRSYISQTYQPDEFIVDPGRRFLVPDQSSTSEGIPVFSVATASIAYRLPISILNGAAFTPDGDTLLGMTWDTTAHANQIIAFDAATGSVLHAGKPDSALIDAFLAVDPARPWLYLIAGAYVQVVDRGSLELVTTLHVPNGFPLPGPYDYVMPVVHGNTLYLVDVGPTTSRIYAVDLLP